MAEIPMNVVINQILAVLRETFEGPAKKWSYFTDNAPDAGYFGSLKNLTAEEASRITGGSSIVSHVYHAIFALNASSKAIGGDQSPQNWTQSWSVQTADETKWSELLSQLREAYSHLVKTIELNAATSQEAFGETIGAVAHAAFHLGAIRQKLALQRST